MSDKEALERLTRHAAWLEMLARAATTSEKERPKRKQLAADIRTFIAEREGLEREAARLNGGFAPDGKTWREFGLAQAEMRGMAESKLSALSEAATALTDFAWTAVSADCDESRDYLNSLVAGLRSALLHPTVPVETNPSDEERAAARRFLHQTLGPKATADSELAAADNNHKADS
jgi:hypothetical protein